MVYKLLGYDILWVRYYDLKSAMAEWHRYKTKACVIMDTFEQRKTRKVFLHSSSLFTFSPQHFVVCLMISFAGFQLYIYIIIYIYMYIISLQHIHYRYDMIWPLGWMFSLPGGGRPWAPCPGRWRRNAQRYTPGESEEEIHHQSHLAPQRLGWGWSWPFFSPV